MHLPAARHNSHFAVSLQGREVAPCFQLDHHGLAGTRSLRFAEMTAGLVLLCYFANAAINAQAQTTAATETPTAQKKPAKAINFLMVAVLV